MNPNESIAAKIAMRRAENRKFLRDAVARGEIADFVRRTTVAHVDNNGILVEKPKETIDAESIREIMTGVSLRGVNGANSDPAVVTSAGVRLFGVTIVGQLDLDDAVGPDGAPMPRLEMTQCWFEDVKIQMERSRLRSLCIRGCRFTELQASEAMIEGPIDISRARPAGADPTDKERCWVVLAGAGIGGRINAAHSRFAAPKKRDQRDWVLYSKHARYALDLRGTRIQGSVNLRPGVTAVGGVCLTLARVEGSLWANGASFDAVEEWAFAADYAQIQGSLYFRPYDSGADTSVEEETITVAKSADFRAKGCMSLFAARIGGSMYFEGAKLKAHQPRNRDTRTEEKTVLNASTAVIGGHCLLRGWISELSEKDAKTVDLDLVSHFVGDGAVNLSAATVGNDLDFSGARVRSIHASNIKVSGDCKLTTYSMANVPRRQPFLATYALHFEGAAIRGNFVMNESRIGSLKEEKNEPLSEVDSRESVIDECDMALRFDECQMATRNAADTLHKFADPRNGFFAEGINIGGKCSMGISDDAETEFRFECAGRISMQEAKLNNSLRMDGAWVVGPKERTTIDLSGIYVGGKATFMTWDKSSQRLGRTFSLWGGDIGLKLTSAKIGQELLMNGASIRGNRTALTAENIEVGGKASLGTYEDNKAHKHHLFCFRALGKVSLVSATIKLGLDMSGAQLHGAGSYGTADGNSSTDALDLTRLHAKYVRLRAHSHCVEGDEHDDKEWQNFHASGKVTLDHADIATYLSFAGSSFEHQLSAAFAKVGGAVLLGKMTLTSGYARRGCSEEEARQDHRQQKHAADLSLRGISIGGSLVVGGPREEDWGLALNDLGKSTHSGKAMPFTVDLRGGHVGELDDLGGRGWGKDLLLWLEGFRYLRLPVSANVPSVKKDLRFYMRRAWDPSSITEPTYSREKMTLETKRRSGLWIERALWLRRQDFDERKRDSDGFSPDVYEQVVRAMNQTGAYEDARHIASLRLTRGNPQNQLARSFALVPLRVFFDYGLSVKRAVLTFSMFVLMGFFAAWVANYGLWNVGRVLIVNVSPPESRLHYVKADRETRESTEILASKDPALDEPTTHPQSPNEYYPEEVPCGDHAESLLYALDVFVPVLDLRQQEACSIAPTHPLWRLAQASYAVLGWIVTSLLILTSSGLLRRHLER